MLKYSLSEAKAELGKSTYPKGFSTKLLIDSGVQKLRPSPRSSRGSWPPLDIDVTINALDHSAFESTFQKFDYDMFIDYAINDISDPDEMASFELDFKDGGSSVLLVVVQQPQGHGLVHQAEARVRPTKRGRALRADPVARRRGRPVRPARLPALHLRHRQDGRGLRGQPRRRLPAGGRLASLST